MYTLEQLQQKNLKELKEIGWQLNVLPEGDRRCRQNWIDALAGKQPPLLELLEVSPVAVEVEPVQEAIEPVTETSPGVNSDPIEVQHQEPIESKFGRIVYPRPTAQKPDGNKTDKTDTNRLGTASPGLHHSRIDTAEPDASSNSFKSGVDKGQICDQLLAASGDSERDWRPVLPHQSPELITNYEELDRPPNRGDNGRERLENEPKMSQSTIARAAKNCPGVKTSTAHQLLELFKSSAHIIPDSPVTERAIAQTEVGQNPIVTGCALSKNFLARYSPPQTQIIHWQSDSDGQLSLLDFEVESDEPPDPDDFETLDAFREAMARWDAENAEALTISMDSMCEWAPCPDDWYEPEAGIMPLKASSMTESCKCWNFSIPTCDTWCDRASQQTDSDEPPDTGIFAKLPGPKPPSFPPVSVAKGDRANSIRKFARSASYSSGRSPPSGGDAM